ncbi:dihydrolipoamide acetyltransferase component of pyruvate dehydrogenase complex [Leuconostoc litchii]|uniref:Dihydrolipoamide acetyltransferase component of pyruvate dehydrogenase complex n=1 Tax=Leuconostoc litchii TaxID=1981069 RepID=A0A6P2CSI3_9LACO|nr:dihydrolipoamide acetyltransferase family protein [Leuconostoc litchii]TYC47199.1 2-oxo acid dehydrogenase subunit E2 [Leuconostoc litchii]GMA69170.1 dihydrolipoamide acetyltransferase component of pyruvate dehydrogenase complex [Leuconostoc litchii]
MTEIFKMPDIGEGMAEGEITSWLVKVGDTIAVDDPVAEVQNDKLIQEMLSPYGGKITKLFVNEGTTVEVGDSLIEFDGNGENDVTDGQNSTKNVTGVATQESTRIAEITKKDNTEESAVKVANGRILAMPSVRHLAYEKGIDLTQVPATGRHGHVTLADVENFQGPTSSIPEQPAISTSTSEMPQQSVITSDETKKESLPREGRQTMAPVRKAIAKAMTSQASIPMVTNFDSVTVDKLVAHRKTFKEPALMDSGVHLTYLAYAVKALAAVAKKFPELNASIDMQTQEIIYHDEVNMGIAVDAPAGLYVPVIKGADQKSILTIAEEITTLAEAVRDGSIKPAQMQGGTITISNLGSARGTWFTPIINGKEVAILGLGSILKEPIVNEDGELAIGQNMKLSLTYDHRLIDGMLGQTALNYLKKLLNDPAYMLMEV